jgi:hypothetical protein
MLGLKLNVATCKECPFNRARPSCGTKGTDGIKFCRAIWSFLIKVGEEYVPCTKRPDAYLGVWDPDNGWLIMPSRFAELLVPSGRIAPGEIDP